MIIEESINGVTVRYDNLKKSITLIMDSGSITFHQDNWYRMNTAVNAFIEHSAIVHETIK